MEWRRIRDGAKVRNFYLKPGKKAPSKVMAILVYLGC